MRFDQQNQTLVGDGGTLRLAENDEIARKFAMLLEGECEGLGPLQAAEKYGYSKQRYFQLRQVFQQHGALVAQDFHVLAVEGKLYQAGFPRHHVDADLKRRNQNG